MKRDDKRNCLNIEEIFAVWVKESSLYGDFIFFTTEYFCKIVDIGFLFHISKDIVFSQPFGSDHILWTFEKISILIDRWNGFYW